MGTKSYHVQHNDTMDTNHMFGAWMNSVGGKLKRQILVGASAFYWVIWLSTNDVVFDKAIIKSFL
jgi:hypothetical protein